MNNLFNNGAGDMERKKRPAQKLEAACNNKGGILEFQVPMLSRRASGGHKLCTLCTLLCMSEELRVSALLIGPGVGDVPGLVHQIQGLLEVLYTNSFSATQSNTAAQS